MKLYHSGVFCKGNFAVCCKRMSWWWMNSIGMKLPRRTSPRLTHLLRKPRPSCLPPVYNRHQRVGGIPGICCGKWRGGVLWGADGLWWSTPCGVDSPWLVRDHILEPRPHSVSFSAAGHWEGSHWLCYRCVRGRITTQCDNRPGSKQALARRGGGIMRSTQLRGGIKYQGINHNKHPGFYRWRFAWGGVKAPITGPYQIGS